MTVIPRREIPEAARWMLAALAVIGGLTLLAREVRRHNLTAAKTKAEWERKYAS